MTESVNRPGERVGEGNCFTESHERTDERTDEDSNDGAHNSDRGLRAGEEEAESNSANTAHPHPREVLAHHRKPEIQRLRAILLMSSAPKTKRGDSCDQKE